MPGADYKFAGYSVAMAAPSEPLPATELSLRMEYTARFSAVMSPVWLEQGPALSEG